MSWSWAAGYVRGSTQGQVSEAIRNTYEKKTRRRIRLAEEEEYKKAQFSASRFFSAISMIRNEWTAFWDHSARLCEWVFKLNGLSGLSMGGFEDSWEYSIWHNGELLDWFVSNTRFYFNGWSPLSLIKDVYPYFQRKGRSIPEELRDTRDTGRIQSLIEESSDIFAGDIELLMQFTKPYADRAQVRNVLSMQTRPALYASSEILKVPFAGPAYNIVDIAFFLDMQRGKLSPPQDLHYLDKSIANRYDRSSVWKSNVSKFKPLLFELAPGLDRGVVERDDEMADLFYAQL
jgi:hypothetical protein